MRIFLCAMLCTLLAVTSISVYASTDIVDNAQNISGELVTIELEYLWVYGITETVEIRGDGLVRVERHVHDSEIFDGLRARLSEKGKLSPYENSIYAMEEGDYDAYWVGEVDVEEYSALFETLASSGFPDIEESYGDWEVWAITLKAGDEEARIGQVVRDIDPGFETILDAIDEISSILKDTSEVDEEEFIEYFDAESSLGGTS